MRRKIVYTPDNPKRCASCGEIIPNRRCYCEKCKRERDNEYSRFRYHTKDYKPLARPCAVCGLPTKLAQSTYCSEECRIIAERRRDYDKKPHLSSYAPAGVDSLPYGWNRDHLQTRKSLHPNMDSCYINSDETNVLRKDDLLL